MQVKLPVGVNVSVNGYLFPSSIANGWTDGWMDGNFGRAQHSLECSKAFQQGVKSSAADFDCCCQKQEQKKLQNI